MFLAPRQEACVFSLPLSLLPEDSQPSFSLVINVCHHLHELPLLSLSEGFGTILNLWNLSSSSSYHEVFTESFTKCTVGYCCSLDHRKVFPPQGRLSSIDVHILSVAYVEKKQTDLASHINELTRSFNGPHGSPLSPHHPAPAQAHCQNCRP